MAQKKIASVRIARRLEMIDKSEKKLSIRKQCNLLDVNRSRVYYKASPAIGRDIAMMNFIDEEFTAHPFTGVQRMVSIFRREKDLVVNHKRVRRLMRKMGLMAIYPKPRTTQSVIEHAKYPCLIRKLDINEPDHVWCSDVTYIRMAGGFMYLVAVMDYFSRFVLSWSVSNSLESLFCLDALDEALSSSKPKIFHSDQGSQYTCSDFVDELKSRRIEISMSGRGRCFDNILAERLWRTVKYEEVYLKDYADEAEARRELRRYFRFYNQERLHQALDYHTPAEVYEGRTRGDQDRAAARTVAVTPVALRAPFVTATVL